MSHKQRKRAFREMMLPFSLMVLALVLAVSVPSAPAQASASPSDDSAPQVALPASDIIELLRRDPGLLLVIKKRLVREAYNQGAILQESDLTQDAVFRLVNEDQNVRILVTREIEARGYLRTRPRASDVEAAAAQSAQPEASEPPAPEPTAPAEQSRAATPAPAKPKAPTQDELPSMLQIRPDDLPTLLAARSSSGLSQAPGRGGIGGSSSPSILGSALSEIGTPVQDEIPPKTASQPKPKPAAPAAAKRADGGPIQRRANPYADVPSLYDLYSQVSHRSPVLERFGLQIFRNGSGNMDDLPMDLPVGPDYVLGPGDGLNIDLWGSTSQRLKRVVDRTGRISLPEVGLVQVSGRSLGDVQREVVGALRSQFREVQADLSLARLRSIRVYVVGDVERPGAYDISSLSTPLNAIYSAGGPTARGSIRTLRHLRGKQLVQEIDSYDLILHGVHSDLKRMEPGDTILVPPVGPEVTVEGMVRRPAIYELHGQTNLAEALEIAGGVMASGTLRHIDVERVEAHERRVMLSLDLPESNDQAAVNKALEDFKVQDGDKIRIQPILPYSYKTVYLDGHVFRPGKYPYREGMKVGDLIKSYSDLLPEPSGRHAELIRLQAPDYRPVVMAFNLAEALSGKGEPLLLQPFDTVRVFGRYDFEDPPTITISGEVRDPGEHRTNGEIHLRDAVYLAGGLTPDAMLDEVQVFRNINNSTVKVLSASLAKALAGEATDNILLQPKDRVIVHKNLARLDPPTVFVRGEVANPGRFPLGQNMTASDLVRVAGGLKRSAYTEAADLSRYLAKDGQKVSGEHREIELAKALSGDANADVPLKDGDVLTIRQVAGWNDIGAAITVNGEVAHPGTYGIREGERLSSIIQRAGGFRSTAYPAGSVLERAQVRELAEKTRQEMIRRLETSMPSVKPGFTATASEAQSVAQAAVLQQQRTLAALKSQPASGRLVIRVSSDVNKWQNTPADIEVRAGDVVFIPKRPNFVLVNGQVYNPAALTYTPGKNAGWYLRQAGGPTDLANKGNIFIVRSNGSVIGKHGAGWWSGNVLSTVLQPGDTVVVPEKIISGSPVLKDLMGSAQLLSQLAIAARVVTSF